MIEQDALYGGHLASFLGLYTQRTEDLITIFCTFPEGKENVGIPTFTPTTHDSILPRDSRKPARSPTGVPTPLWRRVNASSTSSFVSVHHWEHVVRFSQRLIHALERVLTGGLVVHGELFASSVCVGHSWCSTHDLRETLSASKAVGPFHLKQGRLPPYARWYHTHTDHVCPALLEWSAHRGDPQLEARIRTECNGDFRSHLEVPEKVAWSAQRTGASAQIAELRPLTQLVVGQASNCDFCCREGLDWCCPNVSFAQ